ncbi:MAG: histidine kinase dimerization/phospho-acceptor domain-containing protein, partial [Bacteroidota bacterium]|nr:histidine kinase dimerization/phospho-acceptor domain-containing protein [Bacteroidota bacterium]
MKNPTHITVGRLSALAVSLVLFALLLISKLFLAVDLNWLIIIVIPLLLLLASSLIIAYAINYFIYRKIKVIYKNIYETKKSQPDKSNFKKMHGDILAEVSGEVVEWGKNKKKEQKKMRKMGSYRKEFLANVFHELKTPVFNIQGYIETLLEGGLDDKEVNKKFLHKANENVERITNIVDDLQLITNLEEGSFILRLEKFDITKLVWEVLDSLDIIAGTKHITLEVKE